MNRRFKNGMAPVHPGEILREEYLVPLKMSANRLAMSLGIPTNRITEIINERRAISADTALRLARALNTSPDFWLNLQKRFELRTAEIELGAKLKAIKPIPMPDSAGTR
jgi:addiction module HigA family antidote